jgi:hypothetical protein
MKTFITLILALVSTGAFAQSSPSHVSYSMPAIELGFKSNSADVAGSQSTRQKNSFQLGASAVIDFSSAFGLKTGLFYSERAFEAVFPGGLVSEGKINYFEIPAQLMFKFEEYAGVYAGPSLAIKLGDDLGGGSTAEGTLTPLTLGAQFKFLPNVGINLFFETIPGDLATGVSNSRAVGANLLIVLD